VSAQSAIRAARAVVAVAVVSVCVVLAFALPSAAFVLEARLTPDALGVPTNLSSSMTLSDGVALPDTVSRLAVYGPAGLRLDLRGLATCQRTALEADGPEACPLESRLGFGGGIAVVDLGAQTVKESYTLELFLAPAERGRLTILIYASAADPIAAQLVLTAHEARAAPPYGFGLVVDVPPINVLPEGASASIESSYVSLGSSNVAYYETVGGARKLVHVKGLIAPATCSRGFAFEAIVTFDDGTTSTGKFLSRCPGGRR
jgi:hypothetical protein